MIVVWRVLDTCNLACPFCAYDKRLAFPRNEMQPEIIRRFVETLGEYRRATSEPVLLSWLGGEPLLWKHFEEMTLLARSQNLDVSITTNGTALGNPKLSRFIVDHLKELTVSVDGFADLHDTMRGWKGGFNKLRQWVRRLADQACGDGSDLKLKANVVLMRRNVTSFEALCEELSSWGITEITFNQLGGRDRPEFYPENRLLPEQVRAFAAALPAIRNRFAGRLSIIGGDAYLNRILASSLDQAIPVADCAPGTSFLFIDERGHVSPCSFTSDDYAVDVNELRTMGDIVALPARFRALRRAQCSASCKDCMSTQTASKFALPGLQEIAA